MKQFNRILLILLVGVLSLAACGPVSSVQPAEPTEISSPDTATTEPAATAETHSTEVVTPAETITPVAMPTSRGSALQATDPGTVAFGKGTPQLVEFFAFW